MSGKRVSRVLAFLSVAFFAVTILTVSAHADTMAFEDTIQIEIVPREEGIGMVLGVMAGIINRFEGHSILIEGYGEQPQPIPLGATLKLTVPSIIFGPDAGGFGGIDSDTMESNDRVLRRIAEILNRFEDHSVHIEGHANPTTPPGTALRAEEETGSPYILGLQPLSEERAQTVLEHLVGLGVDRARLSAVGMGGTRAIVEYEDRGYWWQNRRVEFLLIRE